MNRFLICLTDKKKNKITVLVMLLLFILNIASILLLLSPDIKDSVFSVVFYPFIMIQIISLMTPIPGTYLLLLYLFSRLIVEIFFQLRKKS